MKSDIRMVFEGKYIEANYIKSVLEENGIDSLLKDNLKGQLYPVYAAIGWITQVKIYVKKENEEKACEIIKDCLFQEE